MSYHEIVEEAVRLGHRRFFIPLPDGKSPYLERFILDEQTDGSKTYLHVIYASDGDRDPHDHPWNFESTIVWGSYREETYLRTCANGHPRFLTREDVLWCPTCGNHLVPDQLRMMGTFTPGSVNRKQAHDLHRLTIVQGPVVTLVKRGPKVREWGFQTLSGWEDARSYIARKFPDAQATEVD